jgi:hypothetical protein
MSLPRSHKPLITRCTSLCICEISSVSPIAYLGSNITHRISSRTSRIIPGASAVDNDCFRCHCSTHFPNGRGFSCRSRDRLEDQFRVARRKFSNNINGKKSSRFWQTVAVASFFVERERDRTGARNAPDYRLTRKDPLGAAAQIRHGSWPVAQSGRQWPHPSPGSLPRGKIRGGRT